MIVVSRKEIYTIKTKERDLTLTDVHEKKFLYNHFFPIVDFLSNKGFNLPIPGVVAGSDANYIYKKLSSEGSRLGRPAEELCLLIYMRLSNKEIYINHSELFKI